MALAELCDMLIGRLSDINDGKQECLSKEEQMAYGELIKDARFGINKINVYYFI